MSAARRILHTVSVGLCAALAAAPAFAQHLGQAPDGPDIPIWRIVGAFLLCTGLAVGGALALRSRLGGGPAPPLFSRGPRRLGLIESIRLSRQVDVCLYRCDEREFMVVTSPQGSCVVTVRDALGEQSATDIEPLAVRGSSARPRRRRPVVAKPAPSPELQ